MDDSGPVECDEYRAALPEWDRSKVGRMARLCGKVEIASLPTRLPRRLWHDRPLVMQAIASLSGKRPFAGQQSALAILDPIRH